MLRRMAAIPASDFFNPSTVEDPYPLYARMRALGPVCELQGTRAFYVAQHAAIEEAVRRPDDFSSRLSGVLVCDGDGQVRSFEFGVGDTASDVIATADAPGHAVQRRLLMPPLKASRVAAMEPAIRDFAHERVRRFVGAGGGDWCAVVGETLPAFVAAGGPSSRLSRSTCRCVRRAARPAGSPPTLSGLTSEGTQHEPEKRKCAPATLGGSANHRLF